MIAKVVPRRGAANQTRTSGRRLMAYLLGPGDKPGAQPAGAEFGVPAGNTHTEPRLVASWDPQATAAWAAACRGVDWSTPGQAWAVLAGVARGVADDACAELAGLRRPLTSNGIWHTVMAADPRDGLLTDEQWEQVARRLMRETQLDTGSNSAVRWVAIRHGVNEAGADHIHVMAVLARADGTKPRIHNDALAAQRAARWAETQFGLVPGRGRTHANQAKAGSLRADNTATRGEMAAAAKAGAPYQRPAGMPEHVWAGLQRQGVDRAWTRQGRARAAVLSAAARAVSMDHLVALMAEQGYLVRLRRSQRDPTQVTGWAIVAPAEHPQGRPKAYRGAQLGKDCSWQRVSEHVARLAEARGTGLVGSEDEAMIGRERMVAAGWGAQMIEDVLTADRMLGEGTADSSTAYWLRDAFWQVAWELEGQHRQHGVFTDAAYSYAAIATGGVPPVPTEVIEAMAGLRAQYDQVLARVDELRAAAGARRAESREMEHRGRAWDEWSDRIDAAARPHVPSYLLLPGGQRLAGVAWARISMARQGIDRATAALAQAADAHRAYAARERELLAEGRAHGAETEALAEWVRQAKVYEGQLQAAIDEHAAARAAWRDGIGALLVDARRLDDSEAIERIEAIDARYGTGAGDRPPLLGAAGSR